MKATLYEYPLYGKVPSLLGNKLAQVFNSGDFIFVAPMNPKAYLGIGLTYICDEPGITEELIYDNTKEEPMPVNMTKIRMRNFYIIGSSSEPYNQQQNMRERHIRDLQ